MLLYIKIRYDLCTCAFRAITRFQTLLELAYVAFFQGRREGGTERVVCHRASGSSGPHQLISTFLFLAFLGVFREPPHRSNLQGSKSALDSIPPISLAFCPFSSLRSQAKDPHFAVLHVGLKTSRRPCIFIYNSALQCNDKKIQIVLGVSKN